MNTLVLNLGCFCKLCCYLIGFWLISARGYSLFAEPHWSSWDHTMWVMYALRLNDVVLAILPFWPLRRLTCPDSPTGV